MAAYVLEQEGFLKFDQTYRTITATPKGILAQKKMELILSLLGEQ